MGIVGSRCAMLIMREAYYGTRRFEEFQHRIAVSPATASSHLSALVDAGLLERRPYQRAGQRTRDEYHLTAAGTDLLPVILGLFQWGRKHGGVAASIETMHADCGSPVTVHARCAMGHEVELDDILVQSKS